MTDAIISSLFISMQILGRNFDYLFDKGKWVTNLVTQIVLFFLLFALWTILVIYFWQIVIVLTREKIEQRTLFSVRKIFYHKNIDYEYNEIPITINNVVVGKKYFIHLIGGFNIQFKLSFQYLFTPKGCCGIYIGLHRILCVFYE